MSRSQPTAVRRAAAIAVAALLAAALVGTSSIAASGAPALSPPPPASSTTPLGTTPDPSPDPTSPPDATPAPTPAPTPSPAPTSAAPDPESTPGSRDASKGAARPLIATGSAAIENAGPLSLIATSPDLGCEVRVQNDENPAFFGGSACGTFLAVAGVLYGPADLPAGGSAAPRTPFTPVSQTLSGSGTTTSPYVIRTEVAAGSSGIRLVQQDVYFAGDDRYATAIDIRNTGRTARDVKLWRAGDCYLADSDSGYGAIGSNWVACYSKDTDRVLQWIDDAHTGATTMQGHYDSVWSTIGAQELFTDACDCATEQDNGAGLSWARTIPANGIDLVAHHTAFSSATAGLDSDGDGLPDDWEVNGTPGGIDLKALGADPDRKDLFVYLDFMQAGDRTLLERMQGIPKTTRPAQAAVDDLVRAFAIAPVANPDGSTGITLHVRLPLDGQPFTADIAPTIDDVLGVADRLAAQRLTAAERKVYRYGLIGHRLSADSNSSGYGQVPGDVFTVASRGLGQRMLAGTIAHEFGHTLGLHHGGPIAPEYTLAGDAAYMNCKQQYYSVMNYVYQFGGRDNQVAGVDYSRRTAHNVAYRAVPCSSTSNLIAGRYDVNNDWSNLMYKAGRIGELAAGSLESEPTDVEPTIEDAWQAGLRGNPGDGTVALSSPAVLLATSETDTQSLFFTVRNVGTGSGGYRLSVSVGAGTFTADATLASGESTLLEIAVPRAAVPSLGTHPLTATLRSTAQNAVVGQFAGTVGVFEPSADELDAARSALESAPDPEFSPIAVDDFIDRITPTTVDRVAGADRYQVAINIARAAYPEAGSADVVFVATGANYPDALSAGPAAAALGGPLLLTDGAALLPAVEAEIRRLAPKKIVVVGGVNSVPAAVFTQLEALQPAITRVGGADRYEASRALVRYAFGESGADTVYVATGANFPDALSAGAAAAHLDGAVVLVNGSATGLDVATRESLRALDPDRIVIAGGPNSVSAGIQTQLGAIAPVVRDGGADRFAASVSINSRAFPAADRAFLATGLKFPDALAGSAWAGALDAPLYVTRSECVPVAIVAALDAQGVERVTLIGGTATLTAAVETLTPCAG